MNWNSASLLATACRPALPVALASAVVFLSGSLTLPAEDAPPREAANVASRKSETGYIEYFPGQLPIVLAAPHGGKLIPKELPDRTSGRLQRDAQTAELAMEMRAEMQRRFGQAPHLVICHLARIKLDANRDLKEAAQGHATAEKAWHEYHAFLEEAEKSILLSHPRGLYLDIHGHSHPKQRLELGYLLDKGEIQWPDERLNAPEVAARTSVRLLAGSSPDDFSRLLRGPHCLGALLEKQGVPCVPSPSAELAVEDLYFSGGYNTSRHGSLDGRGLDAVQIEAPVDYRREKGGRETLARALTAALEPYFARHFQMTLPVMKK